jgi:hypothetical protein
VIEFTHIVGLGEGACVGDTDGVAVIASVGDDVEGDEDGSEVGSGVGAAVVQ